MHATTAAFTASRAQPVSSVKESVVLLLVRTEEEIISRVRHQLSLTHYASGRGNRSSSGIQPLDKGGVEQEAIACRALFIPG